MFLYDVTIHFNRQTDTRGATYFVFKVSYFLFCHKFICINVANCDSVQDVETLRPYFFNTWFTDFFSKY